VETNGAERMRIDSAGKILAAAGTNWVGTVSESGQSSVIERGSNANGSFTRYADGTIVMGMREVESRTSSGLTTTAVTFPSVLAVSPATFGYAVATINGGRPDVSTEVHVNDTGSTTGLSIIIERASETSTNFYVAVYGRWF